MEAANRGAADAGGRTIGLNISLPHEQRPNPYSTPELTFQFHYFAMRKMHFAMRANALVDVYAQLRSAEGQRVQISTTAAMIKPSDRKAAAPKQTNRRQRQWNSWRDGSYRESGSAVSLTTSWRCHTPESGRCQVPLRLGASSTTTT